MPASTRSCTRLWSRVSCTICAVADAVGAAVAGPEAAILIVGDGEPDDGAADRARAIVRPARAINSLIDPLERGDRAFDQCVKAIDDGKTQKRLGDLGARYVARFMPAHAVGDRP